MPVHVQATEPAELTLKQEKLITALLSMPSITAAAAVAKVNEKTARRWLKLPHVQAAYKAAQEKVFSEAIAALKMLAGDAVETLKRNLSGDYVPPAVQVRAAQIILAQSIEIHEMSELRLKVAELEILAKQQQGNRY